MLDYLIALLDDSNDFSWQAAKASHTVLLCHMEQGEVTGWSDVKKNDRIRRANAQRHVVPRGTIQAANKSQKFPKINLLRKQVSLCCVCITMIIHATFKNITKPKVYFIDIYAAHALPRMVRFTVLWIVKQKFFLKNPINSGHGR